MESIPPYEYIKMRSEFGFHPEFEDAEPEVMDSVDADPDYEYDWFPLIEQTINIDCIPQMALHEVKARKYETTTTAANQQEGAWPTDLKTYEPNDRSKLRKREMKTDNFSSAVLSLAKRAEGCVEQNNAIDIFEEYFQEEDEGVEATEPPSAKTAAVFRDPNEIKREANCISWHTELSNKLAVAYSNLNFQQTPEGMPITSYVWDVNSPNEPDLTLNPQSPLVCLEFSPRNPDHLVGGCYNGLVAFWDLRKGGNPEKCSVLERSHHDPVYDVKWIQSRSGNEIVSTSSDGRVLWWDVRKLDQGFADSMEMKENKTEFGGLCLGYEQAAGATKYLVGTEQGMVLSIDRKAKKDAESTKSMKVFGQRTGRHHGPIYSIQRNPLHSKYWLTVGDWTARVWMEDLRSPIMTTKYDRSYLTGGCWSPTRAGVFYTTKSDGTLDVWDYYFKQNDPTFSTKVSDCGLRSIRIQSGGALVALGAEDGTTTVLCVSSGLSHAHPEEKGAMGMVFERETAREKHLDKREMQRKREKKEGNRKQEPRFDPFEEETKRVAEKLEAVEKEFYSMMKIAEPAAEPAAEEKEEEKTKEAADADAAATE